ncbi:hypothetical protein FRC14_001669 [Serendipita sp. 396]|nr:hypothetical protein FRC14_001669 [Serendipita sp. 396]KAG8784686.1 hypothetical protein FRC16_002123 [Serendipita sp. 398]
MASELYTTLEPVSAPKILPSAIFVFLPGARDLEMIEYARYQFTLDTWHSWNLHIVK